MKRTQPFTIKEISWIGATMLNSQVTGRQAIIVASILKKCDNALQKSAEETGELDLAEGLTPEVVPFKLKY